MTIDSEKQKLSTDNLISLYQLDVSKIGGAQPFLFTKSGRPGGSVVFDGQTYTAMDMVATGFGYDGGGSFPTPEIQVSNVAGLLTVLVKELNGLVGATLTRIRTFEQYLDDGATPDPLQIMPIDKFTVEQKTAHNKVLIKWRLSSIIEQTDRQLPGRLILRDICPFNYRQWNPLTLAFDYTNVICPYDGTNYFTENNVPTTAANDKCGKTLKSCKDRFGATNEVRFGGFPGVSRDRTY